jgi:hypothetical protein
VIANRCYVVGLLWSAKASAHTDADLGLLATRHCSTYIAIQKTLEGYTNVLENLRATNLAEFEGLPRCDATLAIEEVAKGLVSSSKEIQALEGWEPLSCALHNGNSAGSMALQDWSQFFKISSGLAGAYAHLQSIHVIVEAETRFWKGLRTLNTLIACVRRLVDGGSVDDFRHVEAIIRTITSSRLRTDCSIPHNVILKSLDSVTRATQKEVEDEMEVLKEQESDRLSSFESAFSQCTEELGGYLRSMRISPSDSPDEDGPPPEDVLDDAAPPSGDGGPPPEDMFTDMDLDDATFGGGPPSPEDTFDDMDLSDATSGDEFSTPPKAKKAAPSGNRGGLKGTRNYTKMIQQLAERVEPAYLVRPSTANQITFI